MLHIFLVTDTCYSNPNPGDILIGKGIEWLLRQSLPKDTIYHYINIFNQAKEEWQVAKELADLVIICGTPQLGKGIPAHFNQSFYELVRQVKDRGIPVVDGWVGFVDQNSNYVIPDSISKILTAHKQFIISNFSLYDAIISRDLITSLVLERCKINNMQLIDSVWFSPLYYGVYNQPKRFKLCLTVRDLGSSSRNQALSSRFKEFINDKTIVVAHTIQDYLLFKDFLPVICINNPYSLVQLYSQVQRVISVRVHGSVLAASLGAAVCNIQTDSRSNILSYIGVQSIPILTFLTKGLTTFFRCSRTKGELDKSKFQSLVLKILEDKLR